MIKDVILQAVHVVNSCWSQESSNEQDYGVPGWSS